MRLVWKVLKRRPSRLVGVAFLLLFTLMAIFGNLIYSHALNVDPNNIYAAPSWKHILGTDYAGRDVWEQIVRGSTNVLWVAALAACFTMALGTIIGLAAGYLGRVVDAILMRITDLFLTIPSVALLLILAVTLGMSNMVVLALLLSLTSWGGLARAIRSMVLSFRERSFVEVSRGLGLGRWHILLHDILPNLMPFVWTHLMLAITGAIYGEVGLFFLGVVPFKANNWGVMMNFATGSSGAMYSTQSFMFLAAPILAIVLLQTGIVLCVDAVNELADPRLRSSH
ncbi:peptide/nickel transport system permease protein [Pullulanibacillus pueri]|uniref:Peptide ABC transporter permease n=1 Tax=Pullulanibacillus pueri TaxID=1437324 RepID=A0A8J2ZWH6_9BACL|nr:ABC transporter permease [Pullulanibacillus pueri]MBM7682640.1 peptide/nickel transport system permease protein [Pullulanibacillus pueri]GGH82616.1 peptide ABC transporter permease [Pullulanibacillus pueri]